MTQQHQWTPEYKRTEDDDLRRVGVEVELAGLSPDKIVHLLQLRFGGVEEIESPFVYHLKDSRLGNFRIELDAELLKKHGEQIEVEEDESGKDLRMKVIDLYTDALTNSAELFVPWEIVTDPIKMKELSILNPIFPELRKAGAEGTKESLRYAFGVHLNPELPSLEAETILRYLQAYIVMHDWLVEKENVDLMRRITPYIAPFKTEYIQKVLAPDYKPTMEQLIDDYLEYNPTRNRSLDMLPLFAHIDEQRVREVVKDSRVKARPTLHYRLPNCEIDEPSWELWTVWQNWLQVELLANHKSLPELAAEYLESMQNLSHRFSNKWSEQIDDQLEKIDPA